MVRSDIKFGKPWARFCYAVLLLLPMIALVFTTTTWCSPPMRVLRYVQCCICLIPTARGRTPSVSGLRCTYYYSRTGPIGPHKIHLSTVLIGLPSLHPHLLLLYSLNRLFSSLQTKLFPSSYALPSDQLTNNKFPICKVCVYLLNEWFPLWYTKIFV